MDIACDSLSVVSKVTFKVDKNSVMRVYIKLTSKKRGRGRVWW